MAQKIYKPEELVIEANENPRQGICSTTDAFKEGDWHTGINKIDAIKVFLNEDAPEDGIKVKEKATGSVLFKIEGQKALLLPLLANGLKALLGIKVI